MNDLDLSVKTQSGVEYPNGQNSRDSINTVERIQFTPENDSEVRVVVAATNLATYGQRYSLVVTGCFDRQLTSDSELDQHQFVIEDFVSTRSLCPSNRLFQVEMNSGVDEQQMTWNLIKILSDGGVEELLSGPPTNNADGSMSTCLDVSARYRYQVRSNTGDVIQSRLQLTYADAVVFDSQSAQLGRVSTIRFETDENGLYHQQGRTSSYTTHVEVSDSTEVRVEGSSSLTSSSPEGADLSYLGDEDEDEDEGSESVGVINYQSLGVIDYQSLSMQMENFQSLSMPMIVDQIESI